MEILTLGDTSILDGLSNYDEDSECRRDCGDCHNDCNDCGFYDCSHDDDCYSECEEECSRDYGCACDDYDYCSGDDCDCHCEWDE